MIRTLCIVLTLLLIAARSISGVEVTNSLVVILYDVRAHRVVPGAGVSVMPLGPDNMAMGYLPSDPNSHPVNLGLTATTNKEGRASFQIAELLNAVDRVNKELAESPRKRITKHYEVGMWVLARGYQCAPGLESLHQILKTGVVENIEAPQCRSDVKPENFHVKPGEIVVFVAHAI